MGPEQYAVFVVLPSGELEMRFVEVGLRDFVNAEILSGLEPGETVSIGVETSTDTSSAPETGADERPPPGMFRFFGG